MGWSLEPPHGPDNEDTLQVPGGDIDRGTQLDQDGTAADLLLPT
jgi:hypothetical protein